MTTGVFYLADAEAVSLRAASIVIDHANASIVSKGGFTLAVSGGATPLRLFELLGTTYRNAISWDRTDIFWVDERCVPPDHQDSNYSSVRDLLLSGIQMPAGNVHRIRGELAPEEGALEYERELRKCFGSSGLPVFDLVLLGVGEDGHIASLFPDEPSLSENDRLAVPVCPASLQCWRITLTLPVLNNAAVILFLVTGRNKADITGKIIGNSNDRHSYPAALIAPVHGAVAWLIDEAAAVNVRTFVPGEEGTI